MKLEFTQEARDDLIRLRRFIAKKNPLAAKRYSERLKQSLKKLTDHPQLGRELDESSGARELVSGDYIARYLVKKDRVTIIKIRHSKEDR